MAKFGTTKSKVSVFLILFSSSIGINLCFETVNADNIEISAEWILLDLDITPPGMQDATLSYDPINDMALLFGGTNGKDFDQTWVFHPSNLTWQQLTIDGPGFLSHHSMEYVPTIEKFVLYGGTYDAPGWQWKTDTWTFDAKTMSWEKLNTTGIPSSIVLTSITYNPLTETILMFGGWGEGFSPENSVWEFFPLNNTWLEVQTVNTPISRWEHGFFYDYGIGQCVLYGGDGEVQAKFDETWLYDHQIRNWTQIENTTTPYSDDSFYSVTDFAAATDLIENKTYFTRDFALQYFDGQEWHPIIDNKEKEYLATRLQFTYLSSIDRFLQYGGHNGNLYLGETYLIKISGGIRSQITLTTTESTPQISSNSSTSTTISPAESKTKEASFLFYLPIFILVLFGKKLSKLDE